MITAYYLCHCGSGLSCFYDKIDLVKETDDSYTFHANAYDYKKCYFRIHTIKAKKRFIHNIHGDRVEKIEWNSQLPQFRFHFIKKLEFADQAPTHFIKDGQKMYGVTYR